MERQIKFRLHDAKGNIVGYEEHRKDENGCYQIYQVSSKMNTGRPHKEFMIREGFYISHVYKCQFTGMADSMSIDIYETDYLENVGVVSYDINNACYITSSNGNPLALSHSHRAVIGNSLQHPELLKTT